MRGFLITLHKAIAFKIGAFRSVLYRDKIDEQIPTFMPEGHREPELEFSNCFT